MKYKNNNKSLGGRECHYGCTCRRAERLHLSGKKTSLSLLNGNQKKSVSLDNTLMCRAQRGEAVCLVSVCVLVQAFSLSVRPR